MSIGSIASPYPASGYQALNPPAPPAAGEAALTKAPGQHNHHHNATENAPTTSAASANTVTIGPTAGTGASGNPPAGINLTV